ncbi:patatin-like phospholipase family protein [Roseibium polysiphoniae]|uniref:Patatin-like phospholipase family protein n=1 Tax=Roseibium polysiphoniae TaxID=2571221 RepID=A0ABR9CDS4_9HYPH|nr:patatin-like phospholipase family protein [Roseibium polysiphoniae]MBD8878041.1 patatin-like phospholipase family protein [Roseibium polysiphoniae]
MSKLRVGLALGGGGARGMSHIPVLEALDDLGVKPHAIAGTSIGAIFGAAYAGGLSGAEIRDIAMETFGERNKVLASLWKLRPRKLAELFDGNMVQFDPLKVLHAFVGDNIPETFEDLSIPLKVLATDFYGGREIDIESGPLMPAVAASIAIPAIFKPIKREGRILVDGGVVNPLPFDRLPDSCDFILAVDVVGSPVPRPGRQLPTSMDALFGTSQILMQTITAEKLKSRSPDLLVRPPDDNIRVLDFLKTKHILDVAAPLSETVKRGVTTAIEAHEQNRNFE